ncbi:hypothetical protein ACG873_04985 [Mesorhizobium sp. AaZ16]|uniref:hypothetical protein n=1 Tax=Mesorhizobium sp. AaZ16 TaxID=3402289 RepID=UPI00374FBA66
MPPLPLNNRPSPLPSPREGRGEGGINAAASSFSTGRTELRSALATPSPRPSRGEGKGEGQSATKGEGQLAFSDICRWLTSTRNDLQAPAVSIAPAITQAIDTLTAAGAGFARMSGSGATCFGLFRNDGRGRPRSRANPGAPARMVGGRHRKHCLKGSCR